MAIDQTQTNTEEKRGFSRRNLLGTSAKIAGAGALAAMVGTGTVTKALAHEERPPDCDFDSDIEVLNYALTLEHLEYNFYLQGQDLFDAGDFEYAFRDGYYGGAPGRNLADYGFKVLDGERVYSLFNDIRDHESQHVSTLQSVISSLSGTPVGECTYDFGFQGTGGRRSRNGQNIANYIATAQALENTGVMAYTGAINCLLNADLLEAGATIATVEARHASFLNLLNSDSPFPAAFDTPKTKCEIFSIASQFIVDCPPEVLALFDDCSI